MADPKKITGGASTSGRKTVALKENPSVVIVDSGMGGLSICAVIVEGLERRRPPKQADIIYFNAWPDQERGYNSLSDQAERIRAFDAALDGIRAFAPDIVLIACNTLSILYPHTVFSRTAQLPVVGMVDFGVELILDHLLRQPERQVVILGTMTTIASALHRDSLIAHGIDGRRIVSQACDQLATAIEFGPDSPKVRAMIDDFVVQAVSKLHYPDAPVAAAFCCTHYAYSAALFKSSFEAALASDIVVLNPNAAMGDYFLELMDAFGSREGGANLRIVSRIQWSERNVSAIAGALKPISPPTASALLNYRYDPGLFSF